MNSNRKTAIVAGVFYILATVAGIMSAAFGPDLDSPDYLARLSSNEYRFITGSLLEFTMAVMIVGITANIYPTLKKHNEPLALGYVIFRSTEVIILTLCALCLLILLPLSQKIVLVGSQDCYSFQTLATLLLTVREFAGGLFSAIIFSLSAMILNYILYLLKLIPRWLSGWGLIGAILYFGSGFLPLFGHDPRSAIYILMETPLGLNEMVFAIWLISKGFNMHAIASENVDPAI